MEVKIIKEAVREVFHEEMPEILKEIVLNLIPEEQPKKDEENFVKEKIDLKDYVALEEVMKKYE